MAYGAFSSGIRPASNRMQFGSDLVSDLRLLCYSLLNIGAKSNTFLLYNDPSMNPETRDKKKSVCLLTGPDDLRITKVIFCGTISDCIWIVTSAGRWICAAFV